MAVSGSRLLSRPPLLGSVVLLLVNDDELLTNDELMLLGMCLEVHSAKVGSGE